MLHALLIAILVQIHRHVHSAILDQFSTITHVSQPAQLEPSPLMEDVNNVTALVLHATALAVKIAQLVPMDSFN